MSAERIFVGTFAPGLPDQPDGVYVLERSTPGASLTGVGHAPTTRSGWVTLHPSGRVLYAVNEVSEVEGRPGGSVTAFSIDGPTGRLTALGTAATSTAAPCHCVVDATGRFLLVASYLEAAVHVFPIDTEGGLGPATDVRHHTGSGAHPRRQSRAHAHGVTFDPAQRFVLVPDLGTDRVVVYGWDATAGRLTPHPERDAVVTAGSGPRHLAFHPQAPLAYLINEMAATLTVFGYRPRTGELVELQTVSTLPAGFTGFRGAAEVAVHPSGRFVYATNRSYPTSSMPPELGLDSVAWFAVDADSGRLTSRGQVGSGGETPRHLAIDPGGSLLYVANQRSSSVVTFALDEVSGEPVATGEVAPAPAPVCLALAAGLSSS